MRVILAKVILKLRMDVLSLKLPGSLDVLVILRHYYKTIVPLTVQVTIVQRKIVVIVSLLLRSLMVVTQNRPLKFVRVNTTFAGRKTVRKQFLLC